MLGIAPPISLKDGILETTLPAFVMAIVNCTPDSFWEQSRFNNRISGNIHSNNLQQTAEYILMQFEKGADIVDIGGESTRPGASYIHEDEELERIIPVIQEVRKHSRGIISVDTRKSVVLKEALLAGADILNDISALEDDKNIVQIASEEKIPIILMHKRSNPLTMQQNTVYNDIIGDVSNYLSSRVHYAISNGVDSLKIILDVGIGFGKDTKGNIILMNASSQIQKMVEKNTNCLVHGCLVGLSRKSFIGDITGKDVEKRLIGTVASNLLAVQHGARMLRVHDVEETVDMLKIVQNC